jgi:chemotaxis signal transduction protein
MTQFTKTIKDILDEPIVATQAIASRTIDTPFTTTALGQSPLTEDLSQEEIAEDGTLYLSLILSANQQVLIPSHQVVEIISVEPTQLTTIPQVEKPIMGIYSWRGEVLWVVDGAALLGDVALCDRNFWSPRYSIFVIRESGEHIGIMVPDVGNLGKRSRFCSHADPPTGDDPLTSSQTKFRSIQMISCPPIVDLVDRIGELRHQLRATWN